MSSNVPVCPMLDKFVKLSDFTTNLDNVGRRTARTEPDMLCYMTRTEAVIISLTAEVRVQRGRRSRATEKYIFLL